MRPTLASGPPASGRLTGSRASGPLRCRLFAYPAVALVLACDDGSGTAVDPDTSSDAADTATEADSPEGTGQPLETVVLLESVEINSDGASPSFHNQRADLDWGEGPFSSVVLSVTLDSPCYPFERWQDDPPPQGHNFPPSCDAFDRNFEVALDLPLAEGDPPGLELVRAITPFGGPMAFDVDLTDIANGLPGAHRLNINIPTYSDGSGGVTGSAGRWYVSAALAVQRGPAPRRVLLVAPLFYGSYGAGQPNDTAQVHIPEGTTEVEVAYRVTGHGGAQDGSVTCIGPAEEFCQRQHEVFVDGDLLDRLVPWREDCADFCTRTQHPNGFEYCLENPTGAIFSVEAPRANWCPGSITPPFTWRPRGLARPGEHSFGFAIADVAEGGTWRVSASLIAFGDRR